MAGNKGRLRVENATETREQAEQTMETLSNMALNMELQPNSAQSTLNTKVAISRVSPPKTPISKTRAKRACIECRNLKTKCDGYQPCTRCSRLAIACAYVHNKKENMERRLQECESQIQVYEHLLRRMQLQMNFQDEEMIARTLAQYSPSSDQSEGEEDGDFLSELEDGTKYIREDFHGNKSLQSIGFVGRPSDIAWIKDLNLAVGDANFLETSPSNQRAEANRPPILSMVSYFLDDQELTLDGIVDPYDRPPPDIADRLLHLFLHTVQPSFPIISRVSFLEQASIYYTASPVQPTKRWLAILNLVFAVAAKFAQLMSEPYAQYIDDPMVFFARARKLAFADSQLIDHPNLQQVQIEGLLAFFLMTIGHINRSWRACGIAIRSAIAMGINLQSESKQTSNISKEIRYRVWWSIYTLENTLSIMTGRPTGTADRFITTPLPIPFEEEHFREVTAAGLLTDLNKRTEFIRAITPTTHPSHRIPDTASPERPGEHELDPVMAEIIPNSSLYFLYFVEITKIMRRGIDSLYSPGSAKRPWATVSAVISDLVLDTETWLRGLPDVFQFTSAQTSTAFERQRWSLAFRYYTVRITISRPSLCRSGRRRSSKENYQAAHQTTAEMCVNAACEMLDLLPNQPDVLWLIQMSPWWCVLHYIMQSVTVLLIELESCVRVSVIDTVNLNLHVEKALAWLLAMASVSVAAQRAWNVCDGIYRRIFSRTTSVQSEYAMAPGPQQGAGYTFSGTCQAVPLAYPSAPPNVGMPEYMNMGLPQNMMLHPVLETGYDESMPS
ncbi:fungal-specific transcription factor domain-containing protein [Aspergillus avenaceus]|uniref:Fungal-specific transcription factor domain-containing protein n=1 Tax=Aspergillus avenaceus TaxID=36643 RepID=A0A5N6TX82_ASPAV|nr:fungal-specific transcription factor domain-containing protein [Aspergillus avenaceus]